MRNEATGEHMASAQSTAVPYSVSIDSASLARHRWHQIMRADNCGHITLSGHKVDAALVLHLLSSWRLAAAVPRLCPDRRRSGDGGNEGAADDDCGLHVPRTYRVRKPKFTTATEAEVFTKCGEGDPPAAASGALQHSIPASPLRVPRKRSSRPPLSCLAAPFRSGDPLVMDWALSARDPDTRWRTHGFPDWAPHDGNVMKKGITGTTVGDVATWAWPQGEVGRHIREHKIGVSFLRSYAHMGTMRLRVLRAPVPAEPFAVRGGAHSVCRNVTLPGALPYGLRAPVELASETVDCMWDERASLSREVVLGFGNATQAKTYDEALRQAGAGAPAEDLWANSCLLLEVAIVASDPPRPVNKVKITNLLLF